jgi:hypothetical protein
MEQVMMQRQMRPSDLTRLAHHGLSWSSEHSESLALAAALLLLEVLPVEAWLLVLAGTTPTGLSAVAIPFWFLICALVVAWALRHAAPRRGSRLRRASIFVFLATYLALLRVSPATYGHVATGPFDPSWLAALANDFTTGSGRLFDGFGLLLALVYVWWRGSALGQSNMEAQNVLLRFRIGLGVMLAAVVVAALDRSQAQRATIGALALLLPAHVYVGLVGAALIRAAHVVDDVRDASTRRSPWLRTALALSTAAVGLALALSLVVNYDSVGALLAHAGPFGDALAGGARALIGGLSAALYFVFSTIGHALGGAHSTVTQTPQPTCQPSATNDCGPLNPKYNMVPSFWHTLALLLVQVLALAAIAGACVVIVRRMLGSVPAGFQRAVGEERESLDASALLRAQLRNLFSRARRVEVAEQEPLAPGSVRALYREVLTAAARRELPRRETETPDEFAARLDTALDGLTAEPVSTYDLRVLSEAYDVARYAERDPQGEPLASLAQRAARLLRRLDWPPAR